MLTYPAVTDVHFASHIVQQMSRQSDLKSLLPFFRPSVQSDISAKWQMLKCVQVSPLGWENVHKQTRGRILLADTFLLVYMTTVLSFTPIYGQPDKPPPQYLLLVTTLFQWKGSIEHSRQAVLPAPASAMAAL